MTLIQQLLTLAREYGAAADVKASTVSWRVFGDAKKLDAIVEGADIQTRRFEAALIWFSENWPNSATWPNGIARPAGVA